MFITNILDQSAMFILACFVLSALCIEGVLRLSQPWAIPALVGYTTIAIWYLLEPLYFPEPFKEFAADVFDASCFQIVEFLICLRFFMWLMTRLWLQKSRAHEVAQLPAAQFLRFSAILWLILLSFGVYRLNGDVVTALFPFDSRAGVNMWSRGAGSDAGDTGFLVSTASYLYTLTCSSFGILLPFIRRSSTRWLAIALIAISSPFFLMQGSRNIFLAMFMPAFASYFLFAPRSFARKCVVAIVAFVSVNFWFQIVISYRDVGFGEIWAGDFNETISEARHLGLNMMSELCYINEFYEARLLDISYGIRYLEELANIVPRAIWPDKPLVGSDYSALRGFSGGDSDIGVFATISSGLIGQGFLNFGPYFGPAGAALLFAGWIILLARFRQQQQSVLRLTLFLLGLGLTFNLGRDFTMLVLWPIAFGYMIVRYLELKQGLLATVQMSRQSAPVRSNSDTAPQPPAANPQL